MPPKTRKSAKPLGTPVGGPPLSKASTSSNGMQPGLFDKAGGQQGQKSAKTLPKKPGEEDDAYAVWAWLTQLRNHKDLCKTIVQLRDHAKMHRVTLGFVQAMVYSCLAINDPSLLGTLGDELKVDLVQLNRKSHADMAEASDAGVALAEPAGYEETSAAVLVSHAAKQPTVPWRLNDVVSSALSAGSMRERGVLADKARSYIDAALSIQAAFRHRQAHRTIERRNLSLTSEQRIEEISHCLVFGACNLDMKAEVREPFHALAGMTTVGVFASSGGGKGANKAVSVARLGVPTSLVGRIGSDSISQGLLDLIKATRLLDLSGLVLDKRNPSSMAIQLVARGRAEGMSDKVTVFCQGAHEFVGEQELASLRQRITPKVKTVVLQLELPTAPTQQAAREAHARGCDVVLKCSPMPPHDVPKALAVLPLADTCFCNEVEAPLLLGMGQAHTPLRTMAQAALAAELMLARWPSLHTAVISCRSGYVLRQRRTPPGFQGTPSGPKGRQKAVLGVAPPPSDAPCVELMLPRRHHAVTEVIGAGDAFVGGYVAAKCRRLCAAQALVWGHFTAMYSTQHVGAQDSMPTWHEVFGLMDTELAAIPRQQMTTARSAADASGAAVHGAPASSSSSSGEGGGSEPVGAAATLEPPLTARLPVASPHYLLQNELHVATMCADLPRVSALLISHGELLLQRDAFGLTPVQRAYECWVLSGHAPRYIDTLRLLLAARLARGAVGAAAPLQLQPCRADAPPRLVVANRDTAAAAAAAAASSDLIAAASRPPPYSAADARGGRGPSGGDHAQPVPASMFGTPLPPQQPAAAAQLVLDLLRMPPSGLLPGMSHEETLVALTAQKELALHCVLPALQSALPPSRRRALEGSSPMMAPAAANAPAAGPPLTPKKAAAAAAAAPARPAPTPKGAKKKGGANKGANKGAGAGAGAGGAPLATPTGGGAAQQQPAMSMSAEARATAGLRAFSAALYEARTASGDSLLMVAAGLGALEIVQLLLEALSTWPAAAAAQYATTVNAKRESALHVAAAGGYLDVIGALLEHTALVLEGPSVGDAAGRSPLDLCTPLDRALLEQLHCSPSLEESRLADLTFELQHDSPDVIFSYSSRTDGGKGTAWMWMLANVLREGGVHSYNARQTPPGGDWLQEWFGRLPDAKVCVAMFSPSYFASDKCKAELYEAAKSRLTILPVIFEELPNGVARYEKGWYGQSREEHLRGNVLKSRIGNFLPPPDKGVFQRQFRANATAFLERVNRILENGGGIEADSLIIDPQGSMQALTLESL